MVEFLDEDGRKLIEKEFYSYPDSDNLVYFTGKYGEKTGLPVFEMETEMGNERELPLFVVKRLYRMEKQDALLRLEELKKKTIWLEERVKD